MAVEALVQVLAARAEVGFAVAAGGVIDGERDDRAAGGFHAPQNFLVQRPRRSLHRVDTRPAGRVPC